MNIKIKSTQIYEGYKEEQEEIYKESKVNILDKNIIINYNEDEIIFDKTKNSVEIKRKENNILLQLNKEKEFIYKTPYGNMRMKTFCDEINIRENPFKLSFEYQITLENMEKYKNIIEIIEI